MPNFYDIHKNTAIFKVQILKTNLKLSYSTQLGLDDLNVITTSRSPWQPTGV